MTISSRTPEGLPHRCPVCGETSAVEPSYPGGDACCPVCGQLLWELRDRLGQRGIDNRFDIDAMLADLGVDSLELVELAMELEEIYDINVTEDEASQLQTVNDWLRFIRRRQQETDDA